MRERGGEREVGSEFCFALRLGGVGESGWECSRTVCS